MQSPLSILAESAAQLLRPSKPGIRSREDRCFVRGSRHRIWRACISVAAASVFPASAATVNWDTDGVTPVNGGTGTWNTTSTVWEDGAGNYFSWNNATPDSAVFGGTAGTVSLGDAIVAASILFNSSNYVIDLAGNNLTVNGSTGGSTSTTGGTAIIRNTGATLATYVTGSLSNANGMRLQGNMNVTLGGSWTPSNDNDFTGTLWLKPIAATSTLLVERNTMLGSAGGLIKLDGSAFTSQINFNPTSTTRFHTYTRDIELTHGASTFAELRVNGALEATLTGVISGGTAGGAGLRYVAGQGNLVLAGANTYVGSTAFTGQSGMITLAHDQALGSTSGVSFTAGGLQTLAFRGGVNINLPAITVDLGSTNASASGFGTLHALSGNNVLASTVQTTSSSTMPSFIGAEAGSSLTLTGVVGGSGRKGVTKIGAGTLILTGANTYGRNNGTGVLNATNVKEGTLRLDFSQALVTDNIVNNGITNWGSNAISELALSGGTLEIIGKPGVANVQQFKDRAPTNLASPLTSNPGFTIQAGASAVRAIQNGATSLTVNLGQLSAPLRFVGSTVDFTVPGNGSVVLPAGGVGTPNTILTANGAAFATVEGVDWAALDSSRNIVPGSSIPNFYTPNTPTTLAGNVQMSSGDTILGADSTIESLRFHESGTRVINLMDKVLTIGGILITPAGNGASYILSGRLRGTATSVTGTNQDLVVIQNSVAGPLTISSMIVDNVDGTTPATGFTKSGAGTVVLTGANTYTGETHLNGGMVKLEEVGTLGSGKLIFHGGVLGLPGGASFTRVLSTTALDNTVQFIGSGGFAAYGGDVAINLGGASAQLTMGGTNGFVQTGSAFILGASDATGTVIVENPVFLRAPNQTQQREIRVENGSADVDGRLAAGFVGANQDGGLTKTGNGTLEVAGAAGAYTGPTIIEGGTLRVGFAGAIPNTPLTVRAGTYDLNGFNMTASRIVLNLGGGAASTTSAILTGAGTLTLGTNVAYNGTIDNGASISGNLALGTAQRTFTVSNSTATSNDLTIFAGISGTGGVTKLGPGTLHLAGDNTYTGPTNISEGALVVSGSIGLGSPVNVNGGTLGGTGIVGAVTLAGSGKVAPGFSAGVLNTGSVTLNGGGLEIEIIDTVTFDQWNVAGAISFNAPVVLSLAVASALPQSAAFTIVNNDGADPIAFADSLARFVHDGDALDEGAIFDVAGGFGSQAFQISYAGGDGNDVVLTAVPEPGSAVLLLAGLGSFIGGRRRRPRA